MRLAKLLEALRNVAPQPGQSIEQIRTDLADMAANIPAADGVSVAPCTVGGVSGEWVVPHGYGGDRVVLYLHGGGYACGSAAGVRGVTSRIALAAPARILSLDYRLAPEHPYPAGVDDVVAAYEWVLANASAPGNVAIGGDSAGGGLAVAALLAIRDRGLPRPAAGFGLSPWVDLSCTAESALANRANDPMVALWFLKRLAGYYAGERGEAEVSPVSADLGGLPPLLVQVGTEDALVDDAHLLTRRVAAAGGSVTLQVWAEMIHVWHVYAPRLTEASDALDGVGTWVREHCCGESVQQAETM